MVIYQKLLPRTKKRGVFYLSLKISLLNRLASYDEYPPGLWPCLLFCFPMKPGLLHLYVCVCAQSGKSVPLLVQNSLEVVAMRSRLICLNHQQTIVKSAFGKGISCRSALAAIV